MGGAELAVQVFRDRSRSMVWWSVGVVAMVLIIVLLYPSVRGADGLNDYTEELPEALRGLLAGGELDITSPAGYLNSQLFAITAPLLLLIFGIGLGARLIAGEEEDGMLDLVLAQPVSRGQLVVQRLAALAVLCLVLGLVTFLVTVLSSVIVDLEIGTGAVAAASLSSVLLGTLFGSFAMMVGALRPGRGRAVGIASVVAIVAWLLDGLGQAVGFLEPWRPASPFYQLIGVNPLREGAPWGGWTLAVGLTVAFASIAVVGFRARDIR